MNLMTFAGRRGELRWDKGIQYDAFLVKYGLVVPFALGDLVHAWDFSSEGGGTCKAIKLRPNSALKNRVLTADWTLMGGVLLFLGSFKLFSIAPLLGAVGFLLSLAMIVGGYSLMRDTTRSRQIRRVLGPHDFGSSDPATWSKSIRRDLVDPEVAFGVETYCDLAKQAMADGEWCIAMWAARLRYAVEDEQLGEDLTDAILDEDDVCDGLRRVGRSPGAHKKEFGKPPRLEKLLHCKPSFHIFEIT